WIVAVLAGVAVSIPLAAAAIAPAESASLTAAGAHNTPVPVEAAIPGTGIHEAGVLPPRPAVIPQSPSAISGQVFDQLGGAMPGVRLTLTDPRNGTQLTEEANAAGVF